MGTAFLQYISITSTVHRCGPGGSMRACYAVGPEFDPRSGQISWLRFFPGFFSPVRQMSRSFMPPRSPIIIWPSSLSPLTIHYGLQLPEMLTRPKTLNIRTITSTTDCCTLLLTCLPIAFHDRSATFTTGDF